MTSRRYAIWPDTSHGRQQARNRGQAIRTALTHMVADGRPSATRIALIGGFDRGSRAIRTAVTSAAAEHGWGLLDLPAVPAFGAIPADGDITVVVPANHRMRGAAHRCAAAWACRVVDPAAVVTHPSDLAARSCPAVAVTTADGLSDHCASRWEIRGSLTYRTSTGPVTPVTALAVEPADDGIVLDQVRDDDHRHARLGSTSVTLRLDLPTEGAIDGHAQTFPAGRYTFVAQPQRYVHLTGPG
ncbi:hypothetical protein [Amycolatopsis sp. lyj-108]|uniref:hypothetical protein n=1 Tax=Amycolatopsis sp. lyj-108 TaxID=2789286 RepID=UPI00397A0703